MKLFFLFFSISLITNSLAYTASDCTYYRHIKPVENLNFLVCVIGIQLPPHITVIPYIRNEPVKGLLIGNSRDVFDDSLFSTLTSITYYGLLNHHIQHVSKQNLEYLTHLEGLDITNGNLAKVDYDAFQDFTFLRDLDLSNNKLDYLHPQIFTTLTALEKLNLKGNQLIALEAEMFANSNKLSMLNVQDNRISYIHPNTFERNHELRELYMTGNVCLNIDFKPPRVQTLRFMFAQKCRENYEIINILSDKRNDAESINYEDERDERDN